eukprot:2898662-Prymnesium_polylepis.2
MRIGLVHYSGRTGTVRYARRANTKTLRVQQRARRAGAARTVQRARGRQARAQRAVTVMPSI